MDVLTITVPTTGERGEAAVTVTDAVLSAFVGETDESYVVVSFEDACVITTIRYSVYDVNEDGIVNQLDITRAQRLFGSENVENRADVDKDGDVDITDLILILNHYTK